jgi:hypothetical protein
VLLDFFKRMYKCYFFSGNKILKKEQVSDPSFREK